MTLARAFVPCVFAFTLIAGTSAAATTLRVPNAELVPVSFSELKGWADDDHAHAFGAFRISCEAIQRRERAKVTVKPLERAMREPCKGAEAKAKDADNGAARNFFEKYFRPVRISRVGEEEGFITGYYEPEIEGSLEPIDGFTVPFHRRPPELRMRAAGSTKAKGPSRAAASKRTKAGTRQGGRIVPFYDRAAIEDGALKGRGLELVWTNDEIEAFFTHIQGSARVRLRDGRIMRINYHAQNGHPYLAVGRILIERGIVPKEEMSMDKIRTFIAEHPEEGRELMRMNRSYIFFREVEELGQNDEPIGAQGVMLTADRSIAVDRNLHVYGTPFWIDAELPLDHDYAANSFRRLMVAQDTGGAIIGPARADIYFGAGIEAGAVAGRLRHPGRFYMLVPRALDPVKTAQVPMPVPRPAKPKQ